jgi:hypothetical protein
MVLLARSFCELTWRTVNKSEPARRRVFQELGIAWVILLERGWGRGQRGQAGPCTLLPAPLDIRTFFLLSRCA